MLGDYLMGFARDQPGERERARFLTGSEMMSTRSDSRR